MSLYLYDSYHAFHLTEQVSALIRDLLRFAQGKAKEGDARFRRSLESLTGQVGMDLDHAQFIRSLAERLGGHRPTEADSEDLAYALHLLAGYEFRLMELLAAEETGEVVNRRTTNWCIVPAPTRSWAEAVYPELERETAMVATPYGPVRVKIGRRGSVVYNAWPEFEDCQRLAAEAGVAVKEVLAEALAAWRSGSGKPA